MAQKDVLSNSLLTLLWTLVHATVSGSALTLSYDSSEACQNYASYCRKYTTHFHLHAKFKVYAQLTVPSDETRNNWQVDLDCSVPNTITVNFTFLNSSEARQLLAQEVRLECRNDSTQVGRHVQQTVYSIL